MAEIEKLKNPLSFGDIYDKINEIIDGGSGMVKTEWSSEDISVEPGKAYVYSISPTSISIHSLPGADNYEESSIWFVCGDTAPTISIDSGISYKVVGELTTEAGLSYVLSIMANTLILAEVTDVA
jgi:hypothetical protein